MLIPDRAHGIKQKLTAQALGDEHDRPVIGIAEITGTAAVNPASQNRTDLAEHESADHITMLTRISNRVDEAVIHQSLFEISIEPCPVIRILATRRRRRIIGLEQRLIRNGQRRPDDEADIDHTLRGLHGNRNGIGSVAGNRARILSDAGGLQGAAHHRDAALDPALVMAAHAVGPKDPRPNARRD